MKKIFEIVRDDPDLKIEIASSRPIGWRIGSEIIMWYQNNNYSHVLVILNDMVFQSTHLRVNVIPLELFLLDHVIVERLEIQKAKCDFEFLFGSLGKKYGFRAIWDIGVKFVLLTKLKLIRKFKYKDDGSQNLICSEYVGKFLDLTWVNDLTDPKEVIRYLMSIRKGIDLV